MATDEEVADARAKLEKEYKDVMESLGDLYVAIEAVKTADLDSDLVGLLDAVANEANKARTGGMIGSGAKGHRRALKDYQSLLGQ